ncbi:hypothetical protein SUGI_0388280 [Cryptomeria japonica]|nr:hypothetical protein SUGI_0388280 [Cryptomeria japonica]
MRAVLPRLLLVRRASLSLPKHFAVVFSYSTVSNAVEGQEESIASEQVSQDSALDSLLNIPWFPLPIKHLPEDYHKTYSPPYRIPSDTTSSRRKELSRERKKKRVIKTMQKYRFGELIKTYGKMIGGEVNLDILGELGRESGLREYNAMIEVCVNKAKETADEKGSLKQLNTASTVFERIREQGMQPDKFSYRPLFAYVANKGMAEEFYCLVQQMEEDGVNISDIGYFEMVLWIKDGNKDEVVGLCDQVLRSESDKGSALADGFLLALSENDWTEEALGLLEKVEITQVSALVCLISIFKWLGRARLQERAEKYIHALKTKGTEQDSLSDFMCEYALSLMDMELEEIILIFKGMHEHLGVQPSSSSYNKLIEHYCGTFKVHMAVDLIEEMCKAGLNVSAETFHPILHACERTNELELVPLTYAVMRNYGLQPTGETVKYVVNSFLKMKNFKAVYNLLEEMRELKIRPTVHLYNSIMAAYFRENNDSQAMAILKEMEDADLKPDAETYSCLIYHSKSLKTSEKHLKKMKRLNIPPSKHVYMALINVYVNHDKISKAKEIVKDQRDEDYSIEITSTLITALASNGRVSEAFEIYEEIKKVGQVPEPKAIRILIEHLGMQSKFSEMFRLLNEYRDKQDWYSVCSKIVLCCIEHRQISHAIDVLQQLKVREKSSVDIVCNEIFSLVCDSNTAKLEDCLALLEAMRKEIFVQPSRTALDFLLSACVSRKDSYTAKLILKEYTNEGFPFNVVTLLRFHGRSQEQD